MLGRFFTESKRFRWLQKLHRWQRISSGWAHDILLRNRMHRVRQPISAAFDTNVSQLCKIERGVFYNEGPQKWGDIVFETRTYGLAEAPVGGKLKEEIYYLNSICELVRRGRINLYRIQTIEGEKNRKKSKHSNQLGAVNIDHGIKYHEMRFECEKLKYKFGKILSNAHERTKEDCSINVGRYAYLLKHFKGKQANDAWHLMICDSFGIEIFFTCDERFIDRYNQISKKIHYENQRCKPMLPSDFCKALGIKATPYAPVDPQGLFRGTIR
ncbi:hypothetical protein SAMN05421512_101192 [Stappia indica]|uniref:Uncharacterized protein n=2 Tax=Stappia indica TaxID=538381 RepID=A0A285R5A7_9HYPH|nr:hypothetical protein SAMN05421512_101192 [Stappia indica]